MKQVRRWRLFDCFMGKHREAGAALLILEMRKKGFKAKVWAPLPQHLTSGHTHVVVLCTLDEKLELAGVPRSPRVNGCSKDY